MQQNVNPPRSQGKKAARGRGSSKPVTLDRLKRQALFYLERFNATEASLRMVLHRKVAKAAFEHVDTDREQAHQWIEDVIRQCVDLGLVNDESFALSRARSLLRGGKSVRAVGIKLREKGVKDTYIQAALERLSEELDIIDNGEESNSHRRLNMEAARAYVRKRRLGGFRSPVQTERYDKDLAALARQGFSFDLSKRVLDETLE